MKVYTYTCECGAIVMTFHQLSIPCSWCRSEWECTEKDFVGYYLCKEEDRYRICHIKANRLILLPDHYGLMCRAKCSSLEDIVDVSLWPGLVQEAHPNSLGTFFT